ncbi:MAG: outer membrane beta-barrel protein [Candidatus Devosia euplotis]|nr:outer membrane beta-barrel protein [Candidatus Devosia euplotis]
MDRALLFGTAGLAVGGITASTSPASPGATGSFSSTVWGWTVGGGAELALADTVSVKAEYAYYDFASVQAPINTIANLGATDIKSRAHTVKLGLNYRF